MMPRLISALMKLGITARSLIHYLNRFTEIMPELANSIMLHYLNPLVQNS